MKRTTNNKCSELVANLIPFKASNLHAEFVDDWYVVYSYGWYPLLCAKKGEGYFSKQGKRYSASTQRQQMYVEREIYALCREMTDEMFKRFERPFKTVQRGNGY